ncbi:MAG: hypothetical protein ACOC44_05390 [Promethearchaeia archaeon]
MLTENKSVKINIICPYCKKSFRRILEELDKDKSLYAILIKDHTNNQNCPPFIAFIDKNGKHRGSQTIDDVGDMESIKEEMINSASDRINELEEELKLYHLKVPRREGRGFEHKVASVKGRIFMSSKIYRDLFSFLKQCEKDNIFGILVCEGMPEIEDGLLLYGKYLGMIFILLYKDPKFIKKKTCEELRGYANLTVEKLLDIYQLADFFF